MALEIRPVRPSEYEEAGRVTADAYRELGFDPSPRGDYLDRVADIGTRTRHALVLVAFEDGRIIGTVTVELEGRIPGGHPRPPLQPDQAHVRMLGVDPGSQRRGVGRRLMEACIDQARGAGKDRLTLETTQRMTAAQRMYESMGFRRGPDEVYDDGFRLLTYELPL